MVLKGLRNVMRKDEVGTPLSREEFLANAPSHVGGMVRVPPVIKTSSS
ncbi:MAG: aspartyl/glutamyl-tRNA amidotransferase subunit C [Chlamydiales bacterium]|nr:aspartyl/glutamyl-tRNA amidotransferase subunit C [Chlamydiales bacterium]